jgi:hypothetical protein
MGSVFFCYTSVLSSVPSVRCKLQDYFICFLSHGSVLFFATNGNVNTVSDSVNGNTCNWLRVVLIKMVIKNSGTEEETGNRYSLCMRVLIALLRMSLI